MADAGRYIPDEVPETLWKIIEDAGGDPERLREILRRLNRGQLSRFAWNYEEAAAHIRPLFDELGLSEDGMLELANWVVAQGKELYRKVWDDPSIITEAQNDPGIFGAAVMEYQRRYGHPLSPTQGFF